MSTNFGCTELSSDAVISSDQPNNSDIALSNGVKDVIRADLLDSKTETLTKVVEPSSDHDRSADIVVQDSIDETRVSGDELGIVMENSEKVLEENVVNNEENDGDKVVVSDELLDSKTETVSMEVTSSDPDGDVKDSIDEARVYTDEKEIVPKNVDEVVDEVISDVVVSAVLSSKNVIDASNEVKIGDDLIDSENGNPTKKEPSSNHDGGGDIAVRDSIDKAKVSGDEKEIVMEDINKDVVVASVPLNSSDIDVGKEGKIGEDLLDSKNGSLTKVEPSSTVEARVSGDDKEIVLEEVEKVLDENVVNDEEKEGEYKFTDLVWGKVKSYPWWPGQIFDPSASTDKAKKHSNKKGFLIAYFGDQSFAWNEVSKIKPFRKNFSKMEKQSNSKGFCNAVNSALDEVSRRIDFGLACSCLSREVYDKVKTQVFVNAGIKKEASRIDGGDNFSTVASFKPVNVVQSVQNLAREHFDGYNTLEIMSVRTRLLAYYRWKGYHQFRTQNIVDGLDNKLEDNPEIPSVEEDKVVEDAKLASEGEKVSSKKRMFKACDSVPSKKEKRLTKVTPKGRDKLDNKSEDDSEEDKVVKDKEPASVGEKVSSKKRMFEACDSVPSKKEKRLTKVTPKGRDKLDNKSEDDSEEDKVVKDTKPASVGEKVSSKKKKLNACDSVPSKKEKNPTNVTPKGSSSVFNGKTKMKKSDGKKTTVESDGIKEGSENGTNDKKSSVSSPKSFFRIGDRISRIAKQLSESPSPALLKKESQKSKHVVEKTSTTDTKKKRKDRESVEE